MVTKALLNGVRVARTLLSSGPRFGTIFVNTDCNRRCVYCMVPQLGTSVVLSSDVWNEIIDRIASWGVGIVNILGGEPTLRTDLSEIVAHAARKVTVSLTSNGDAFVGFKGEERFRTLVSNGLSALSLSLHDIDELDRQLGILHLARTLGVLPILGIVVTKQTIEQIPDVMKEANRRSIFFRFSRYQNVGGIFSSETEDLIPTQSQLVAFASEVQEQKEGTGLVLNTPEYIEDTATISTRGWHCDSYKDNWVMVNSKGQLMACCEYPTPVAVLDIETLKDPRWVQVRTKTRVSCEGCTYQCYKDEEQSRSQLFGEAIETAIGML